ncbi:FKBP-type peptidyl-prolyl cis-trans isomerase [Marivirga arenosa]|uniref:Peptidyl-prolyl cis-trans isomerase n=1 Tax=Marivirga arenosa TaxID=3059076 RepID=A0AA49JCB8_9BACT|nr:FKBP-type peptidyl-prolyl cis-trans isomerase [Marivirga sp. BKB1-2]WKK78792.1 FKBP-type peptidyl-prolyl cis-trans isomerase [Marivirga sp. BKB1-2]
MIRYLLSISILFTIFSSCTSEIQCDQAPDISPDQTNLESQINEIEAYLSAEGLNYQTHSSGIRYVELESGEGRSPNFCSSVSIDYEGRELGSDEIFISAIGSEFSLRTNSVVPGFKIAISLMNRGADYRVFIPAELLINKGISDVFPRNIPEGSNVEFRIRLNTY